MPLQALGLPPDRSQQVLPEGHIEPEFRTPADCSRDGSAAVNGSLPYVKLRRVTTSRGFSFVDRKPLDFQFGTNPFAGRAHALSVIVGSQR